MLVKAIVKHLILLSTFFIRCGCTTDTIKFPDSFKFGAATAAYQIEGAWNVSDKGLSIWDVATHENPKFINDSTNGDNAAKSYEFYKEDVKLLKELGVNFYRFSISWPRILPNGDTSVLSQNGLSYYNNLIDELIANGIEPMVTIFHWDLPQKLQDIGGLLNPLFPDYFEDYANTLFEMFADRVKVWITFNEPALFCRLGYGQGAFPPFMKHPNVGPYTCVHHILIAQAKVYHLYKNNYYNKYSGKIGIALDCKYVWPRDPLNVEDVTVADEAIQFICGWLAHPLFSQTGGYPSVMIKKIEEKSNLEGRLRSRLPLMDNAMREYIQGSADFFGLNYYTSRIIRKLGKMENSTKTKYDIIDLDAILYINSTWKRAHSSDYHYFVPEGLTNILKWIKEEYNNPEIIITENGWQDYEELEDNERIVYLKEHLKAIHKAISVHNCNITGFSYWSLLDNWEWRDGYTVRFGLYYVDYNSTNRTRIAKKSAKAFKEIIRIKAIPEN